MTESPPRRLKGRSYSETRSAVLDLIRSSTTISRVELAQRSSLTEVTISKIVKELLVEGIVIEAGHGQSTGGKRPRLLQLNSGVLYAVGVRLGVARIVIVLCGLNGTLIERVDIAGIGDEAPPAVLSRVAAAIRGIIDARGIWRESIVGIGVASSGRRRGPLGWGADPESAQTWEEFDTAAELVDLCGVPVLIENDANSVALGTFWSGGANATSNFMTVYMDQGIGAGLVINGAIFRGASDNTGEIGHIVVDPDGIPCWCGSRGCLETTGTPRGLVRQVTTDPALRALFDPEQTGDDAAIYDRILDGLTKGQPQAEILINRSVRAVATTLLGLANTLDLERIELAGPGFAATGNRYQKELNKLLHTASFTRAVHPTTIHLGGTGPDIAALGAASVILHSSLTPHHMSAQT